MQIKDYFPVNLDLHGRKCLVVGGGPVGAHKAKSLLSYGANVTVVSPLIKADMKALVKARKVAWIRRGYRRSDLTGCFLVIAATNLVEVNTLVSRHAEARHMLSNVVDVPDLCNFIIPSVLKRGPIIVGVSTGGQSPMIAQKVRRMLAKEIGPHYAVFTRMLGGTRDEVKRQGLTMAQRKVFYRRVINSPILALLEKKQTQEAKRLLQGFMMSDLPKIKKEIRS